jgi:hypothetical protein
MTSDFLPNALSSLVIVDFGSRIAINVLESKEFLQLITTVQAPFT